MNINECEYKGNACYFQQTAEATSSKNFYSSQFPHSSHETFISNVKPEFKSDIKPCEYVSNRTRIRCPNFRKKNELCPKGFCEKVKNLLNNYLFSILVLLKEYTPKESVQRLY